MDDGAEAGPTPVAAADGGPSHRAPTEPVRSTRRWVIAAAVAVVLVVGGVGAYLLATREPEVSEWEQAYQDTLTVLPLLPAKNTRKICGAIDSGLVSPAELVDIATDAGQEYPDAAAAAWVYWCAEQGG